MKYFLDLLKPSPWITLHPSPPAVNGATSPLLPPPSPDKVFLDDFRVAFKVNAASFRECAATSLNDHSQHFKTTDGDKWKSLNLQLPITFCQAKQTRIRTPGDAVEGDPAAWEKLEQDWSSFWTSRGKEKLGKSAQAAVNGG